MTHTIEKHYINAYRSGLESAFQQSTSILSPYVEWEAQEGEFDSYDRVGIADDMKETKTRYGTNPVSEIEHERRWVFTRDFEQGKMIEPKDIEKVANDPTHAYTQAFLASAARKKDDLILQTIEAPASTGKKFGDGQVTMVGTTSGKITVGAVSNATNNIVTDTRYTVTAGSVEGIDIAQNYTGGTAADTGLTLAKMKAIRETMIGTFGITQDTVLNMFVGRRQLNDLLGIDEVINSDYAVRKALAEGSVTTFMGFRFINSERLPVAGGVRSCYVLVPKSVKMALRKGITANMWNLPDRKNIPYMYFAMGIGGVRMWGENLARVRCVES